jgi:hypothetical protein
LKKLENVERTQFIVLTGHLDDRPLPDLIRTLRAQRKSGRLQVEYPDAPGSFFFEDGQLVDAQLGNLRGVEALYAAMEMRGAAFNFNPLVRPPERSIDRQGQKFVWDLIEAPRRENLSEIRVAGRELRDASSATPLDLPPANVAALPPAPQNALVRLEPAAAAALTAPLEARLSAVEAAIASSSRRFSRERLVYAIVISFLVGLTAVTALQAIFGPFFAARARANELARASQTAQPDAPKATTNDAKSSGAATTTATTNAKNEQINANADAPARDGATQTAGATVSDEAATKQRRANAPGVASSTLAAASSSSTSTSTSTPSSTPTSSSSKGARKNSAASGGYVVRVLMEVKDGRVTGARVLNPRPGADAYEALALRLARQRRYPDSFTGGDTWKIRVKP